MSFFSTHLILFVIQNLVKMRTSKSSVILYLMAFYLHFEPKISTCMIMSALFISLIK